MVFLVGGQNMYMNTLLHCHFCIQIITDHFLLIKVSQPIHTIPGINAHLLYPILCPWKYSIRHKLLYCPVCIFWLFPWQPALCGILPLFLYLGGGVLQEMDIISTMRPYDSVLVGHLVSVSMALVDKISYHACGGMQCLFNH